MSDPMRFFDAGPCPTCARPTQLGVCVSCILKRPYRPTFGDLVDRALAHPWTWKAVRLLARMRPRFEPMIVEQHAACASCPFREGNEPQWAKIVRLLRSTGYERTTPYLCADPEKFRRRVWMIGANGHFMCHSSAYRADGSVAPPHEFKQCPGATRWARTGTTIPAGEAR